MTAGGNSPPDHWCFDGPCHAPSLAGDAVVDVVDQLRALIPGWALRPIPSGPPDAEHLAMNRCDGGILLSGGAMARAELVPNAFSAAYHIAGRVFETLAESLPGGLVLHAGAIALGDGAFAFAGPSGTGKSCLGAAFAQAKVRLLGDDRIVVATYEAECRAHPLGLAQKLRLPLPREIANRLQPLLGQRANRRIADSLFLGWDPAVQIAPGASVPLRRIFLLRRDGADPAASIPLSRPEALHGLLENSAAPGGPARHLAAVHAMLERVPVTMLSYESCFDALQAILRACLNNNAAATGDRDGAAL